MTNVNVLTEQAQKTFMELSLKAATKGLTGPEKKTLAGLISKAESLTPAEPKPAKQSKPAKQTSKPAENKPAKQTGKPTDQEIDPAIIQMALEAGYTVENGQLFGEYKGKKYQIKSKHAFDMDISDHIEYIEQAGKIALIEYTDKSYAFVGSTKEVKDKILSVSNATFTRSAVLGLEKFPAWLFSASKLPEVQKAFKGIQILK